MKRPIPKKKNPLEEQTDLMKVIKFIIPHYRYIKQGPSPVTREASTSNVF
jgi:hypothetical protein